MRWILIDDVQKAPAINVLRWSFEKAVVYDGKEKEWILRC